MTRRDPPIRALTLAVGENIAPLSGYLWQLRIAHRIFEERGEQILEVESPARAEEVRALYAAWRSGELVLTAVPRQATRAAQWTLLRYPALLGVLAIAILCYPAAWPLDRGEAGALLPWLTIVPVGIENGSLIAGSLREALQGGELWRLVTPALLHFSFAHIAFNAALLVEFGRRIEHVRGSASFFLAVLTIAAVSNLAQYLVGDSPLFGGLSGVVYGLFGFVVVQGRLDPTQPAWQLKPAFIVFVALFLVAMSTGITESFGLYIANGAHWGGLLTGMLLAVVARRPRRG